MDTIKEILATEYSEKFDELRKKAMVTSYYKYGKASINYKNKYIDSIASLKKRIEKYEETGNTEFLADIANFAMLEFMFPQHKNANYTPTDSGDSPGIVGMSIKEMTDFKENN